MPTYVFRCDCGETVERFLRISEKDANTPVHCGKSMQTVIQPVHGYVQSECHYKCPATGQNVTSWRQRKNLFAEHNLRDASDDNPMKQIEAAKKRKAKQDALAAQMPGSYADVYAKQ